MLPSKLFFVFVIFWLKLLYHQVMWRMCWNFKFWGIKYHCSSFGKIFTKDNIFLNYQSCVSSEAHACVVKFVLRYIGICVQALNLSVKNWILKQKCIHNIDDTKNFIRILKSYFGSKIPNYFAHFISFINFLDYYLFTTTILILQLSLARAAKPDEIYSDNTYMLLSKIYYYISCPSKILSFLKPI